MVDADLVWEKNTAGWVTDKPAEQNEKFHSSYIYITTRILFFMKYYKDPKQLKYFFIKINIPVPLTVKPIYDP